MFKAEKRKRNVALRNNQWLAQDPPWFRPLTSSTTVEWGATAAASKRNHATPRKTRQSVIRSVYVPSLNQVLTPLERVNQQAEERWRERMEKASQPPTEETSDTLQEQPFATLEELPRKIRWQWVKDA